MFDLEKEKKRIVSLFIALQSIIIERKVSDPLEEFFFKACSKTMKECVFGFDQCIEYYQSNKHIQNVIKLLIEYYKNNVVYPLIDHINRIKKLDKKEIAKQIHPKVIIFVN